MLNKTFNVSANILYSTDTGFSFVSDGVITLSTIDFTTIKNELILSVSSSHFF